MKLRLITEDGGLSALKHGNFKLAIALADKALMEFPDDPSPYKILGESYLHLQSLEMALVKFKIYYSEIPEQEVLSIITHIYDKLLKFQEVLDYLKELAIAKDVDNLVLSYIGWYCLKLEDFGGSEYYYTRALEVQPDDTEILPNLATALSKQYRYLEALTFQRRAYDLEPEKFTHIANLGILMVEVGQYEQAEKFLVDALRLKPEDQNLLTVLGSLYLELQMYDESLKILNYANALNGGKSAKILTSIGNVYTSTDKSRKAKDFYLKALDIKKDYPAALLGLYGIPLIYFDREELSGIQYLYRYLKIIENKRLRKVEFDLLIKEILRIEAPILVYRLFGNIYYDSPAQIFQEQNVLSISKITKPFRQQFALWEMQKSRSKDSQIAEAIFYYYLGDPIKAYKIFDEEIEDTLEAPLPILAQYYFYQSALMIGENHDSCLQHYALPQARKIATDPGSSETELYYAALILNLCKQSEQSDYILEKLLTEFEPAWYYRLSKLEKGEFSGEYSMMLKELMIKFPGETYLANPKRIIITEESQNKIKELTQPLLHFFELKSTIEEIRKCQGKTILFDEQYFFARMLDFEYLQEKVATGYLERKNPIVFEKMFGSNEERVLLKHEVAIFEERQLNGIGISSIMSELHKHAFADYIYLQKNISAPSIKTNFRHYLILAATLYDRNSISGYDLFVIQNYIAYCAEKVYFVSADNEFMHLVISEIKGQILRFSIFGISPGAIESLIIFGYKRIRGNKSPMLSFSDFQVEFSNNLTFFDAEFSNI